MPTDDLTAAERQRRLRRRRKLSLSVTTAEMPLPLVEALIEAGLLSENRASDPECLEEVHPELFFWESCGCTSPRYCHTEW